MGYITRIDSNGNAEGNYTLLARKKGPGGWGVMPVGTFFLNENKTGLPVSTLHNATHLIPYLGKGYLCTGKGGNRGIPDYSQINGLVVPMETIHFSFQKYIAFYAYHKPLHLVVIRSSSIFPVHQYSFPNTKSFSN